MKKNKKKTEFSKILLIQESALIWINTLAMLVLAFYCVFKQYFSELPWLAAMVGFPWTAYGVSQHAYYKKSEKPGSCTKHVVVQSQTHPTPKSGLVHPPQDDSSPI